MTPKFTKTCAALTEPERLFPADAARNVAPVFLQRTTVLNLGCRVWLDGETRFLPLSEAGAKGWVGKTEPTLPLPPALAPTPTHPPTHQAGPAASPGQLFRVFMTWQPRQS